MAKNPSYRAGALQRVVAVPITDPAERARLDEARRRARENSEPRVKAYTFDVYLTGVTQITADQAGVLHEQGCDDGTPASRDGLAWIHFDREALSLEEAIGSAIKQVQSAGFTVSKVELDAKAAAVLEAST